MNKETFDPFTVYPEDFHIAGSASDLKISRKNERELANELFSGPNTQKNIVDAFERQQGIGLNPAPTPRLLYKARIFDIENPGDNQLFGDLMNKPQFNIISMKDNFSSRGDHRIFAIYSENLDYVEPKKEK